MGEGKLVENLQDLQEAIHQAVREGICRIRLVGGQSVVLYPTSSPAANEEVHEVTDLEEEKIVLSCLDPGGKTYTSDEARAEILRRRMARRMKNADGVRRVT